MTTTTTKARRTFDPKTDKGSYAKWVFTLNNYTDAEKAVLANCPDFRYVFYGHEVAPTTGTPHLQGFLALPQAQRHSYLMRRLPRARMEPMYGNLKQNDEYCSKEATDLFERGDRPMDKKDAQKKGAKAVKDEWEEYKVLNRAGRMEEIPYHVLARNDQFFMRDYSRHQAKPASLQGELQNEWIYGPSGGGKSTKAETDNPGAFHKDLDVWWTGYAGEDCVIIEDVDEDSRGYGRLLKLMGQHQPFPARIHGGTLGCIRPKKVVITSQYKIDDVFHDPKTRAALHRRYKEVYHNYMGVAPDEERYDYTALQCNPKKRKS